MNVSSVFHLFDSRDGRTHGDRGRNESIKHRRDSKRQPIVYITRHTRAQHGQKNNFRIMPPPPFRRKKTRSPRRSETPRLPGTRHIPSRHCHLPTPGSKTGPSSLGARNVDLRRNFVSPRTRCPRLSLVPVTEHRPREKTRGRWGQQNIKFTQCSFSEAIIETALSSEYFFL